MDTVARGVEHGVVLDVHVLAGLAAVVVPELVEVAHEYAVLAVADGVHVDGVGVVDVAAVEDLGDYILDARERVRRECPQAAVRLDAFEMHPAVGQDEVVAGHVSGA